MSQHKTRISGFTNERRINHHTHTHAHTHAHTQSWQVEGGREGDGYVKVYENKRPPCRLNTPLFDWKDKVWTWKYLHRQTPYVSHHCAVCDPFPTQCTTYILNTLDFDRLSHHIKSNCEMIHLHTPDSRCHRRWQCCEYARDCASTPSTIHTLRAASQQQKCPTNFGSDSDTKAHTHFTSHALEAQAVQWWQYSNPFTAHQKRAVHPSHEVCFKPMSSATIFQSAGHKMCTYETE